MTKILSHKIVNCAVSGKQGPVMPEKLMQVYMGISLGHEAREFGHEVNQCLI